MEVIVSVKKRNSTVSTSLTVNTFSFLNDPTTKTVVVVAETVHPSDRDNPGKLKAIKMESGRMAAQVGHAISKLKLYYLEGLVKKDPQHTNKYISNMVETPITSIILKARNETELYHIGDLCLENELPYVYFSDYNEVFYGSGESICTAIAIGPVHAYKLAGITDYLPLWKDDK